MPLVGGLPVLCDLCGPPITKQLEGTGLRPLLEAPAAPWDRPALTTHGRNNHSLRSEHWRYIRYRDGTEELYSEADDPLEWKNVASEAKNADVRERLAKWLPKVNVEDAPKIKRRRKSRKRRQEQAG